MDYRYFGSIFFRDAPNWGDNRISPYLAVAAAVAGVDRRVGVHVVDSLDVDDDGAAAGARPAEVRESLWCPPDCPGRRPLFFSR
jgi:hypothetical protein